MFRERREKGRYQKIILIAILNNSNLNFHVLSKKFKVDHDPLLVPSHCMETNSYIIFTRENQQIS